MEVCCCAPGLHKSAALKVMMESPISGACHATAMRPIHDVSFTSIGNPVLSSEHHEHNNDHRP
jgi:hypothetical protein